MTGQRQTVVRAVANKRGAFNPEALVDELRPGRVGRATVYRTLELLEGQGMLTRLHLDGCHAFVVCDEGHHHHLVCSSCGAVMAIDASRVEDEIRRLAGDLEFRVDTHLLEFVGRCKDCQAAGN